MAKRVQEVALGTRTARLKLAGRHKPYFRAITEGVHIGYRRSTVTGKAGSWLCRRHLGGTRYKIQLLGIADDLPEKERPADGDTVLTFDHAQAAAREWARLQAAGERRARASAAVVTVRRAVTAYIAARKARSIAAGRDAELRLGHHVLAAPLADMALLDLTDDDLARWRAGLERGGRGAPGKRSTAPLAPATLARLLNDLRAALTEATRKERAPADVQTIIREGLRAPEKPDRARPKQVISDADVRKLVEAAAAHDPDFGALVLFLAATGTRFDQAARMTVADLQVDARRVMVPVSAKGRGTKAASQTPVPLADDAISVLRQLAAGRAGHEPLLTRWHHQQVAGDKAAGTMPTWERVGRRPWTSAAQMTRPWHAILAATGLPRDLVPYCLRHSSIVRALRAGLPVSLVARVHDTSPAMIDKHYGAFIVDATEDLLRRAVVPMAPSQPARIRAVH
jgi:integrase